MPGFLPLSRGGGDSFGGFLSPPGVTTGGVGFGGRLSPPFFCAAAETDSAITAAIAKINPLKIFIAPFHPLPISNASGEEGKYVGIF